MLTRSRRSARCGFSRLNSPELPGLVAIVTQPVGLEMERLPKYNSKIVVNVSKSMETRESSTKELVPQ